jgi:hypothetical protein
VCALTVAIAGLTGFSGTHAALLAAAPTVAVAVACVAVLCAALGARSGGRIGMTVLSRVMTSASDPFGGITAVLWVAPWLLAELVLVAFPILLVGHAARHHKPVGSVGLAATIFALGVAYALAETVRRSKPVE